MEPLVVVDDAPRNVLSLSPCAAFPWLLSGAACAVLITQYLEYAVLSTLTRLRWTGAKTHPELVIAFYQVYWSLVLLFIVAVTIWLYATDRWAYKAVYGLVFFVALEALQLSTAILLTSWKQMAARLRTELQRPWVQTLAGKAAVPRSVSH
ncbi:hypothetical protein Poli38472_007970 [Pythium oligandrum]|uniref:Uncharacterized protein n=1 Tax=Pythium oligandrum TaxID=41045 RepID=A0A8K1CLV4_PYTOL|nr:hypothetical protein Poli38472_007970 [Pythium oligandrum]|eukprot:TMW65328.1 hypothetical protein Poli38472_007970 [Pythium oligandrum]